MSGLEMRPWIRDLDVYVGGKSKVAGVAHPVKLSSNESALGPSPLALEAYINAAPNLHRYPDAASHDLRQAIGSAYKVDPERVICGLGSDEILKLATRAYAGPGDEVIYARHGFMMYPIAARSVGATAVEVADVNYTANIDNILAAITPRTRIIFLANPNNPTGTYLPAGEVKRLLDSLPAHVLLVLDAAYEEFVSGPDYTSGLELAGVRDNLLVTHTFSKLFGLAALRLGWGYGSPAVIDVLNRIRDPFNVPGPTQAAGIAALSDSDFLAKAKAHNEEWRAWLTLQLTELGLKVVPSVTNFVLIEFPEAPAHNAGAANSFLLKNGYILRWLPEQGLGHCLRLTVGLAEENEAVIRLLAQFMKTEND
jgi:histidinol-phosphate aminotransferase